MGSSALPDGKRSPSTIGDRADHSIATPNIHSLIDQLPAAHALQRHQERRTVELRAEMKRRVVVLCEAKYRVLVTCPRSLTSIENVR
jgi:hypothetical protein